MKKNILKASALLLFASSILLSCDTDYGQVGSGIIDATNFETGSDDTASVKMYNKELPANEVRTDNLPVLMLGKYTDPVFGNVQANFVSQLSGISTFFGEKTVEEEAENDISQGNVDEMEQVVKVRLVLPFFSRKIDTDADGISTYELDSVYGGGAMDIKVYEQTEYLRQYDPSTNFEEVQQYFANHAVQYNPTVIGSVTGYFPDPTETVVYERNPDYTIAQDDNGDDIIKERIGPQLEITLDNAFFQSKIIDNEGQDILSNLDLFADFLRGLYIEASNSNSLVAFDYSKAKLVVNYKYTRTNGQGTADTSDDTVGDVLGIMIYNLGPRTITTFNNTISPAVLNAIQNPNQTDGDATIYLKGTVGSEAVIELFNPTELALYRSKNWLINGASLSFYIDNANAVVDKPYRIYLYDYENQEPIIDFVFDSSLSDNPLNNKYIYGGILLNDNEEFDGDTGTHYKINITEHVNRILNEVDDAGVYTYDNVKLGLKVLSNPFDSRASETNPLGVVLVGSNTTDVHKVKLDLNYTQLVN